MLRIGISIELRGCKYQTLREELLKLEGVQDEKMLDDILLSFGHAAGDDYVLLNNEYYEEYNSYYGASIFIDRYYGVDSFRIFLNVMKEVNCNQSLNEVAESLGVTFPEE